jgi:hypothetical protein
MKPQVRTMGPESASPVDTKTLCVRKRWRKVQAVTGRSTPEHIKVGSPHFFGVAGSLEESPNGSAREIPDRLVLTRSSPEWPYCRRYSGE